MTARDHANTVREALGWLETIPQGQSSGEAEAALDALLALAEQNEWAKDEAGDFYRALKDSEARVTELAGWLAEIAAKPYRAEEVIARAALDATAGKEAEDGVVSAYAEPLAQVREALMYAHEASCDLLLPMEGEISGRSCDCQLSEVLAALDLIEQRATDMEKALRQALDCKGSYNGTVSERGGEPAICTKCEEAVLAVLSAREEAAVCEPSTDPAYERRSHRCQHCGRRVRGSDLTLARDPWDGKEKVVCLDADSCAAARGGAR